MQLVAKKEIDVVEHPLEHVTNTSNQHICQWKRDLHL